MLEEAYFDIRLLYSICLVVGIAHISCYSVAGHMVLRGLLKRNLQPSLQEHEGSEIHAQDDEAQDVRFGKFAQNPSGSCW